MKCTKSGLWFVTGGLLGYGVIHPLVMISAQGMSPEVHGQELFFISTVVASFSLTMLPWSLGFGLLSGIVGLLLAAIRHMRIKKLKLQAVMELTGAACHELNQPMQVILGYADLLSRQIDQQDPLCDPLKKIIAQIDRMDAILNKMKNIATYETCEYVHGIKIVDIERCSTHAETCELSQPLTQ